MTKGLATSSADGTMTSPSAAAAVPEVPRDVGAAVRLGLWLLAGGWGVFLAWAALVPLDEGVPAPATVVVENRQTPVQHPSGGVVADLLVREGDRVAAGQPLIRLADVQARAGTDEARAQWLTYRAHEARLLAEQAGDARVRFPEELLALRGDPMARQQMQLQEDLFGTRRAALASEMAAMRQQAAALEAQVTGQQQALAARGRQAALMEQELASVRLMVQDGYTARTRQVELERQLADLGAGMAELRGSQTRLAESLAEARLRLQLRQQDHRREIESQLAEVRREAAAQGERLKAATDSQARTVLRAPVAGQVVGLAGVNPGAVVAPGARLMEIVPDGARLVLEAQVPTHLVDRIHPGMAADVHLQAFVHLPQLVLPGQVSTVSAASLADPATRASYYLVRVDLTAEGRQRLGGRGLQAGMPADVVVRTGERSLLQYLLRPLLKRFSESMKEA